MIAKEAKHLIANEFRLEWRQKNSVMAIVLYIVSTIFVCYLSFKNIIDPSTWNALFWIILLFGSASAVAKSFLQDSRGRLLYMYTIASPQSIILSKMLYNMGLMIFLSLISFLFYGLFIGNIVEDMALFLVTIVLGSAGLASVFTMVSAIASKANNSTVLVVILGFPIILPMLLTLMKLSINAIVGVSWSDSYQFIGVTVLLNLMVVVLSYILFPYLWRD